MVEEHDRVGDKKKHLRESEVILLRTGNTGLETPHRLIAEISHGPAGESGKFGAGLAAVAGHQGLKFAQGIVGAPRLNSSIPIRQGDLFTARLDDGTSSRSDEGKAPDKITLLSRLQEKTRAVAPQF